MAKLKKGVTVNLKKGSGEFSQMTIGAYWGPIVKVRETVENPGWIGKIIGSRPKVTRHETRRGVDLDLLVLCYDIKGKLVDTVYFGSPGRKNASNTIVLDRDDTEGDAPTDEDNERTRFWLDRIPDKTHTIFVAINSFRSDKFDDIPYAGVRIYKTLNPKVKVDESEVAYSFEIAKNPEFKGAITMLAAKFTRAADGWDMTTIGKASNAYRIQGTDEWIRSEYL